MHIGAYLAVVDVHLHDLLSLHAAQLLLIRGLQPALAYIVAPLVVGVLLQVALVHLAYIAQYVRRNGPVVDTQCTLRDVETFELVQHIFPAAKVLLRYLFHENRSRVRRIDIRFFHPAEEVLARDTHRAAEESRVQVLHHAGDDHQVVHRLVIHQQLAVAVVHESSRWILCDIAQRLILGFLLVLLVEQLQHRQPEHKQYPYRQEDNLHYATAMCVFVRHFISFVLTCKNTKKKRIRQIPVPHSLAVGKTSLTSFNLASSLCPSSLVIRYHER